MPDRLGDVRGRDPEKFELLNAFLGRLQRREVLPEAEDIRQFAQQIGMKTIGGKRREDTVRELMKFLLDQSTASIRANLEGVERITEQERRQGFSILADKLIRGR